MSDDIKMYVYGQISRTSRSHMTSDLKIGVLFINCHLDEKNSKKQPRGARERELRPFDSELKTISDFSNSLLSKQIILNSLFLFCQ